MNSNKGLPTQKEILAFTATALIVVFGFRFSSTHADNAASFSEPPQRQASPSPTPSALSRKYEAEIRELRKNGPKLPDEIGKGGFTMKALIRGGWPITVEYELEEGAEGYIRFLVPEWKWPPLLYFEKLESTGAGKISRKEFFLPESLPEESLPYQITFDFKEDAHFRLRGIGFGLKTIKKLFKPHSNVRSADFQHRYFIRFPQSDKIKDLKCSPETINTGQGETLSYSFVPGADFSSWAVAFYVDKETNGVEKSYLVRTQRFNEIFENKLVDQRWDGRDDSGGFSDGRHHLAISAWWSDGSDPSVFVQSDQIITVVKP